MNKSLLCTTVAACALIMGAPALAKNDKPKKNQPAPPPAASAPAPAPAANPAANNDAPQFDLGAGLDRASVSPLALDLTAFFRDINAFDGDLDPMRRDINAFNGDLSAFYRDINAFDGSTSPFWGDIELFWGDLNPYRRDINAFGRDINAFWGDLDPMRRDINAFGRDIGAFYRDIGAFWRDIGAFWGELNLQWRDIGAFNDAPGAYDLLTEDLNDLVSRSEATWGQAVTDETGLSFWDGFAKGVFEKHGFDLFDPASLDKVSEGQRARFFLDWYDGLMEFSGFDRVDHWMPQVNWSPSLTQIQGEGGDAIIGLLDFTVGADRDLQNNIAYDGGVSGVTNGHGGAVAGLMVAAHDGRGVMGIAPNATVMAYNPFDRSGTANFEDVTQGLINLGRAGASVVNMSLGVPGGVLNEGWRDVFFDPAFLQVNPETVFVKAAGNDGVEQTNNVEWQFDHATNLIIVGSVDPSGAISEFSNTPGEACLLDAGVCAETNKLKYRFITAPGEMILVSDEKGGVTRATGTSFAAPIVTGAVALMHDRWPWLEGYARETIDIIFQSAQDLGAPGVDGVYGWGLLDIEAAQSPLSFGDLEFYQVDTKNGRLKRKAISASKARRNKQNWESKGVYFIAFEEIGDTQRDFAIPFSSQLVGQTVTVNGVEEQFQTYIYERMRDWQDAGFTDVSSLTAPVRDGAWSIGLTATNLAPDASRQDNELPYALGVTASNLGSGVTLRAGVGAGAMSLSQHGGFGLFSDYNGETGGVNPFLGLASGGAYASMDVAVGPRTRLSFGVTERSNARTFTDPTTGEEHSLVEGAPDYAAAAANLGAVFTLSDALTARIDYTLLHEDTGLLGVQGLSPVDLGGATSDTVTLGADMALARGWSLAVSGSVASTRDGALGDATLSIEDGGLTSTAMQLAAAKQGVFGDHDRMRLSISQPMRVQSGALAFTQLEVIDRSTGETGLVSHRVDMAESNSAFIVEGLYARPVFDGAAQFSAFARAQTGQTDVIGEDTQMLVGGRFSTQF